VHEEGTKLQGKHKDTKKIQTAETKKASKGKKKSDNPQMKQNGKSHFQPESSHWSQVIHYSAQTQLSFKTPVLWCGTTAKQPDSCSHTPINLILFSDIHGLHQHIGLPMRSVST